MANAFIETKNLFISYLQYTGPLSFEQWMDVPEDQKAAVLFVQFFDQITLAWYKADSLRRGSAEDGVSTVLQYLQKNVPIIGSTPKKFTPAYIYRVAYNCLYCICHDIKRDKERFEFERTNIVITNTGEIDLCDLVPTRDEEFSTTQLRAYFWAVIEDMGDAAQAVVSSLIGETELPKQYRVRVSESEKAAIIAELRTRLAVFGENL